METKSFDMEPSWRKKSGMMPTSSTLPRGFTTKSLRRGFSRDEPNKTDMTDLPPMPRRKVTRTTSDSVQNGLLPGRQNSGTSRQKEPTVAETALDNLLKDGKLSSLERVKKYLEDLQNDSGNNSEARSSSHDASTSTIRSSPLASKYWRPRSVYIPETSLTSEFDKYMNFKESLTNYDTFSGFGPTRRASNAYDRIKELHEYRRAVSEQSQAWEQEKPQVVPEEKRSAQSSSLANNSYNGGKTEPEIPQPVDASKPKSVLEKYLGQETKPKKESRFLNKVRNNKKEESRVDKTIKALRDRSVGIENEFSESKLLKRAVSLEDLSQEGACRQTRASSLTPEETSHFKRRDSSKFKKGGVFEKIQSLRDGAKQGGAVKKNEDSPSTEQDEERQARIANLKKLEFTKTDATSTETTPTVDFDEAQSYVSLTDNSDTWSSSDYTERYFEAGNTFLGSTEDNIGERIRRKSFFHRFNTPKRYSYQRSASNMEKKRYF